jgi:type IV pilus assembly protein PilB
VLSTLHTNSAAAAVTRLVDIGAEPFLVASSLALVVAQRLVRKPCAACVVPYTPPSELLNRLGISRAELDGTTPLRGNGCHECTGSGYRGRTGIFEVLPIDPTIREVLLKTPTESAVMQASQSNGMISLREAGLVKARLGLTTFEEVLRVS